MNCVPFAALAFVGVALSACGGRVSLTRGETPGPNGDGAAGGRLPPSGRLDDASSEAVPTLDAAVTEQSNPTGRPGPATPDNSFGTGGSITENFTATSDRWIPASVAVGAGGRVLVAGLANSNPSLEIVRAFTPDGALDSSFGAAGQVTLTVDPTESPQSIGVFDEGGFGIAGGSIFAAGAGLFAARLMPTGAPDLAWANAGIRRYTSAGLGLGAVFDADGAFFAFGEEGGIRVTSDASTIAVPAAANAAALGPADGWTTAHQSLVTRWLATGTPDMSFGDGGTLDLDPTDSGAYRRIRVLLRDRIGRILVVGDHDDGARTYVDLVRLTPEGAVDGSFGGGPGVSLLAGVVLGAALTPALAVVVWTASGAVVRIRDDGVPDSALGGQGIVTLPVLGTVFAGTLDPSGRLLLVGVQTTTPTGGWYINRYWL